MNMVKIIIWDLDDTIWKGTISEGEVTPDQNILSLIKKMTDRGIINSIVSKNDYSVTKEKLEELNVFDYLICPSINWEPKGNRVKELLKKLKLRAENALFIDDNHSNLEEVGFYNPGIMIMYPWEIKKQDVLEKILLSGKDDLGHSRLKEYKQLEHRIIDEEHFSSNREFLLQSNIQVRFDRDCHQSIERIYELIQRTNQLNFTKKRISKNELEELLRDPYSEAVCIRVKDRYGDYGIVGFYFIRNGKLIHFLFSCRILGLGVEGFVWTKLGCPEIEGSDNQERLNQYTKQESIDWIQEITVENVVDSESSEKSKRILMIGGCNLRGISFYLDYNYKIDEEFRVFKNNKDIITSYLTNILGGVIYDKILQSSVCEIHPYLDKELSYQSRIFNNTYDCIILSLVDEYVCCMTRWKKHPEIRVPMLNAYENQIKKNLSEPEIELFYQEFDIIGLKTIDEFKKDLKTVLDMLHPNQHLILVNGSEIDVSEWIGKDMVQRNIEMNRAIDEIVENYRNVELLDVRKMVTDINDLDRSQMDARHFNRDVYFRMSQELIKLVEGCDEIKSGIQDDEVIYIQSKDDLINHIADYKRFYCYGAGRVGMAIADELRQSGVDNVVFLVTKRDPLTERKDYIRELQEVDIDEDCLIVVTVGITLERDIIKILRRIGIRKYALLERSYYNNLINRD